MILTPFSILNAIFCWITGYVLFCLFVVRNPPMTWAGYTLQFAMASGTAALVTAGMMPILDPEHPVTWWSIWIRFSATLGAIALYEQRFGVKRHLCGVFNWFCSLPRLIMEQLREVRFCWRKRVVEAYKEMNE